MAILKFETNIPQLLSLAFTEGKPVMSPMTGAQLMFSTVDADRFYVPPIVGDKLKEHGVRARQQFELCKKQVGRSIEWQVRTHNATAGAVFEATPAAAQVRSINQTIPKEYNCAGHSDQVMAPIPSPGEAAAAPLTRAGTKLMGALAAAVEAVMEAETYCARHGRELSFTSEDVRALAITVYISDCKGGGA